MVSLLKKECGSQTSFCLLSYRIFMIYIVGDSWQNKGKLKANSCRGIPAV